MAARKPKEEVDRRPGILIVEDDALLATMVEDVVTSLGYDVVASVASGEAAVDAARAHGPDLILMDVSL